MAELRTEKPVRVSGAISGSGFSFLGPADRFAGRRLGGTLSASLQFDIAGVWSIPIRAVYSNQGTQLTGPSLSRFGLSPSYKWLTLHGGHRNYALSRYITLGGTVLGGGAEVRLEKFRFLAFHGKVSTDFNLPPEYIGLVDADFEPYRRNSSGALIGFGGSRNGAELALYRAGDDPATGTVDSLIRYGITPAQNASLSLKTNFTVAKSLRLQLEICANTTTDDRFGESLETSDLDPWVNRLGFLIDINESSRYALAYAARLNYSTKGWSIGVEHEHIDPFFNSFGLGSLQSDYDNYLFRTQLSLLKGQVSLGGSVGLQTNNTKDYAATKQRRVIGSANGAYTPSKYAVISASFSNFTSDQVATVSEIADSLRVTTGNLGVTVNGQFRLPTVERNHELTGMVSRQRFQVLRGFSESVTNFSDDYSLGYHYRVDATGLSVGGALSLSGFTQPDLPIVRRYGLRADVGRKLSERSSIRVSLRTDANRSDGEPDGFVYGASAGVNWRFKSNINLVVSSNWLNRRTTILQPFDQVRTNVRITKSF